MKLKQVILSIIFVSVMMKSISVLSQSIALVGGHVIDVSEFGHSSSDIENAIVIIEGDKITSVVNKRSSRIPKDAQIIDVTDKYILPGLIDGYAALDNQGYANAYLYMGITSIVGCYGYKRHPLYTEADPSPNIYLYGDVGHNAMTTDEMLKQIKEHVENNVRFLNLMYGLTPEQVKLAAEKAHVLGMPVIGEFSKLPYQDALDMGIDAFLHFGRYDIEMAPPDMRRRIIEQPHGPAFREFRLWLSTVDPESDTVQQFANMLGSHSAVLIPTLDIPGVDASFFENVWEEPAAKLINPDCIDRPVDLLTGKHKHVSNPEQQAQVDQFIKNILRIEEQFYKAGVKYLAGSGNDINGAMPGVGLHQELELLKMIGLSNREVIAAATSNFADVLGWDEIGQIRSGRRADILVVEKNPLDDIKNLKIIEKLFLRGKQINREQLLQIET